MTIEPRYSIGQQYTAKNKRKDVCTVIDILSTYNAAGDLVSVKYLCSHMFLGQVVKHEEVQATIDMALYHEEFKRRIGRE